MLVPAITLKPQLDEKFAQDIYSERYFYYTGSAFAFELPNIRAQDNYYQWAIVSDKQSMVPLGYLAYYIDTLTDTVCRFGLYSFDEGNILIPKDTFEKLNELCKNHHRVEWRIIGGNHAKRGYDSFCKQHHGNIVCLHDVLKDPKGNYRDEYIYEIIRGTNLS